MNALNIDWSTDLPAVTARQILVIPITKTDDLSSHPRLENVFGVQVREAAEQARFGGKAEDRFEFTREVDGSLQHVLLLGVGEELDGPKARVFAHDAVRRGSTLGAEHVVVDLRDALQIPGDRAGAARLGGLVAQGLQLGTYAYEQFLSEDKRTPVTVDAVTVVADDTKPSEGTRRGQIVAKGIARARDLANGPAELVTPEFLADTARKLADELGKDADVSLEVLDRAECERRGMGCYLGVAQGSDQQPQFIHLSYKPKSGANGRVCLIGKGVTFDSGGYSLKPSDGMLDMKMDMSGAAAVLGAFEPIVKLGVPWEVHVLVAAAENMVSGRAYRLGDVLRASNGRTVEINNTDAEGRLTMADALVFGAKLEPDFMVDFATLTGACMVALGPKIAGVMTPHEGLARAWMSAADHTGENMWRLPLPDDLKEQLKSKIADMKNTGERFGGALTAGLFLSEFTEGKPWMHVDIAGPAMASKAYGVTTPGGTGFPVATVVEFLSGDVKTGN